MIERTDFDAAENRECLDALDSVEDFEGAGRVEARRKCAELSFAAVALLPGVQAGGRQRALRWNRRRGDLIFRVTPLASFPELQTDPNRSHRSMRRPVSQSPAK
jgi:hypothetical protein